jgi:hypothetical protein
MMLKEMHKAGTQATRKQLQLSRANFWLGMKKEVANYIAKCWECQKVKANHRHPASLLQSLPIPEWQWIVVTIDFITKLPRTTK